MLFIVLFVNWLYLICPFCTVCLYKIFTLTSFAVNAECALSTLGGSTSEPATFLLVDQSSPYFFCWTQQGSLSIKFVSRFWYLDQFLRYSQSNLKVVWYQAEFSSFWPSQISGVRAPINLYISYHAHLMAHHVAKFHGSTLFTPKVTGTDMLNFKPILDPLWNKL